MMMSMKRKEYIMRLCLVEIATNTGNIHKLFYDNYLLAKEAVIDLQNYLTNTPIGGYIDGFTIVAPTGEITISPRNVISVSITKIDQWHDKMNTFVVNSTKWGLEDRSYIK